MEDLQQFITNDGTLSLRSLVFKENFHSKIGALKETKNKFIKPSNLKRFKNQSMRVLDICFGLGYNSAFLFNELLRQPTNLEWYGLEVDKRPLNFSCNSNFFKNLWDQKVNKIFESLLNNGKYTDEKFNCDIFWGDARKKIYEIPKYKKFDLIFLDGFSPQKCPEMWTEEFLSTIIQSLNHNGYLITYSSSAAVRKTLIDLKLKVYSIKPNIETSGKWSSGTIAVPNQKSVEDKKNFFIKELSMMELEHLKTRASIPYRDPNLDYTSAQILKIREKEQLESNLLPTELWRKKWYMTNDPFNS